MDGLRVETGSGRPWSSDSSKTEDLSSPRATQAGPLSLAESPRPGGHIGLRPHPTSLSLPQLREKVTPRPQGPHQKTLFLQKLYLFMDSNLGSRLSYLSAVSLALAGWPQQGPKSHPWGPRRTHFSHWEVVLSCTSSQAFIGSSHSKQRPVRPKSLYWPQTTLSTSPSLSG